MANLSHAEVFRTLKPACVRLNDAALKFRSRRSGADSVISAAENLFQVLRSLEVTSQDIDERLVNYAFFPLSHVFRDRGEFPKRAIELALQCVDIFLRTGWRIIGEPAVGIQLLTLLTSLSEDKLSEELSTNSMTCIATLYESIMQSPTCRDSLFSTLNVPVSGHTLSVILDNVKYGSSAKLQIAAINALQLFCNDVATTEVMQSFSPGVFSTLSVILTPKVKARRSYKLLQTAIYILKHLILLLLSDRSYIGSQKTTSKWDDNSNIAWSENAATQMKLVLANVTRLQNHDRAEVRDALLDLCWTVVEDCPMTLVDSLPMMLELTIALSSKEEDERCVRRLQNLVHVQAGFGEHAKTALHKLLLSLPRLAMAPDGDIMSQATWQIATWIRILNRSGTEKTMLDELFQVALRDTLLGVLGMSKGIENVQTAPFPLQVVDESSNISSYADHVNNILPIGPQAKISLGHLQKLISLIAKSQCAYNIANDALERAHDGTNEMRFVDLWICYQALQESVMNRQTPGAYRECSAFEQEENDVCDDLFSVAVSLLKHLDTNDAADWRVHAIALEIMVFQANRFKRHFRPELIDTLYPIIYLFGSSTVPLRNLAVSSLNNIAMACEYTDIRDMMVANSDYLMNTAGLRLAALDVSPQSCKVLITVIKLCGPSLLPYLEDLFDSIFDALECFHGYSELIEQLFHILQATVEEGIKSSPSSESVPHSPHRKYRRVLQSTQGIVDSLNESGTSNTIDAHLQAGIDRASPPYVPQTTHQKDIDNEMEVTNSPTMLQATLNGDTSTSCQNRLEPANIYKVLMHIASLTQHHLPLSSPILRAEHLTLLLRVIPYLSRDEDAFLPLVHTLWPVLLQRLFDSEAFVVARVLTVLSCIFRAAGDFLSNRIEELWPMIQTLDSSMRELRNPPVNHALHAIPDAPPSFPRKSSGHEAQRIEERSSLLILNPEKQSTSKSMLLPRLSGFDDSRYKSSITGIYTSTTVKMVRRALTRFLVDLISHTRTPEHIYLKAFRMVMSSCSLDEGHALAKKALGRINADAVSLSLEMDFTYPRENDATSVKLDWGAITVPSDVLDGRAFTAIL